MHAQSLGVQKFTVRLVTSQHTPTRRVAPEINQIEQLWDRLLSPFDPSGTRLSPVAP